ncbi:MAG: hypothetical protein LBC04_03980 [Holosporaceae bacterium]|jgi:hypothetical protein|nr:hypothetical protein [Holosporaceae bacterium]
MKISNVFVLITACWNCQATSTHNYSNLNEPPRKSDNGFQLPEAEANHTLSAQRKTLTSIQQNTRNRTILEELTAKSIVVTADTLEGLARDSKSAVVQVNLFDQFNWAVMLEAALNYMVDSANNTQNFTLPSKISSNKELYGKVISLRKSLKEISLLNKPDFKDEKFAALYGDITYTFLEVQAKAMNDPSFNTKHFFIRFLNTSQKALELIWVRHHTEDVLSTLRASIERNLSSSTGEQSVDVSVNIPTPIPALNVNLGGSSAESFAGSDASSFAFFTSSKSKTGKAGVTLTLPMGKMSAVGGIEEISTDIFFSLEQVIDHYNSSLLAKMDKGNSQNLKNVKKDRKNLQQKEKELLILMEELEGLLQALKVLPNGVKIDWINITKSKTVDRSQELKSFVAVAGEVSALASLGINIKSAVGSKSYTKESSLMSLINEDCSSVNGIGSDTITKIIGEKYNFSKSIPNPGLLLGHLNSYIGTLTELANAETNKDKNDLTKKKHSYETLLSPSKTVGSFGRVGVLKTCLVTAVALKELDPSDAFMPIFRQLYAAIDRLSKLEEFSKNKSGARKAVGYGEQSSQTSSVKAQTSSLQARVDVSLPLVGTSSAFFERKQISGSPFKGENGKYISLKFSLPLSSIGAVGAKFMMDKLGGTLQRAAARHGIGVDLNDFMQVTNSVATIKETDEEKNERLIQKTSPSAADGIESYGPIDSADVSHDPKREESVIAPVSAPAADVKNSSEDIAMAITQDAAARGAEAALQGLASGADVKIKIYGLSQFEMMYRYVDPITDNIDIIPLPGLEVIKNEKGRWVMDYATVSNLLNSEIGAPASLPISGAVASSVGKILKKTGPDTLHDIIAKSNVLMLGLEDNKSGLNTAYDSLKSTQFEQLRKIFRNIKRLNSNAIFELQIVYNEIMRNMNGKEKNQCKKVFEEFLNACRSLKEPDVAATQSNTGSSELDDLSSSKANSGVDATVDADADNMKTALKAFDAVIRMNYDYNFKPYYDSAYAVRKKSK